jgi:hypothetical protein
MRRVALVTGPLTPLTANFKKVRFGDPDESARILTYGREPWGVVESVKLAYVSSVGANVRVAAPPEPTLEDKAKTMAADSARIESRSTLLRIELSFQRPEPLSRTRCCASDAAQHSEAVTQVTNRERHENEREQ